MVSTQRIALLLTGLAFSFLFSAQPAAADSEAIGELRQQMAAIDWAAELGYEPWRTPEELVTDRAFWNKFLATANALGRCVAEKRGEHWPTRDELDPSQLPPGWDPVVALGFDPWIEPEQLVHDREFWDKSLRTLRKLSVECGRPIAPSGFTGYSNCLGREAPPSILAVAAR